VPAPQKKAAKNYGPLSMMSLHEVGCLSDRQCLFLGRMEGTVASPSDRKQKAWLGNQRGPRSSSGNLAQVNSSTGLKSILMTVEYHGQPWTVFAIAQRHNVVEALQTWDPTQMSKAAQQCKDNFFVCHKLCSHVRGPLVYHLCPRCHSDVTQQFHKYTY
jgi:hypothetical protein